MGAQPQNLPPVIALSSRSTYVAARRAPGRRARRRRRAGRGDLIEVATTKVVGARFACDQPCHERFRAMEERVARIRRVDALEKVPHPR